MAEVTHQHAAQDTQQTTTSATYADITGTSITPAAGSTKYLLIARAIWGTDDITDKGYLRVNTADDTNIGAADTEAAKQAFGIS